MNLSEQWEIMLPILFVFGCSVPLESDPPTRTVEAALVVDSGPIDVAHDCGYGMNHHHESDDGGIALLLLAAIGGIARGRC